MNFKSIAMGLMVSVAALSAVAQDAEAPQNGAADAANGATLADAAGAGEAASVGAGEAGATEVANNAVFGDWVVACEAVTVARTSCRLIQQLTLRETEDLVARFIVLPAADGEAVMLAQMPMGVYLPGGAVYRPESDEAAEQREMIWQRCLGELCEAAIALDAGEIDVLRGEEAILFGYRLDPAADPIVVRVDTSQFGAALDAIMPTS